MKWIKIISQLLFVVGLILLLSFTNKRHNEKRCSDIRIELDRDTQSLLTRGEVILLIESVEDTLVGRPVSEMPLFEIERRLEKLKNIQNAEVFIDLKGVLHVQINQKNAIVRVKPKGQQDFYMDELGSIFNLSSNFTEHLLVANGNIEDSVDVSQVLKLAKYISSDSLWKSQIVQIFVTKNKEIELIPRVGNHTILFGSISNYESKFNNLNHFYKNGVNQVGWNNYKEINLKFKNQIVCVKK